VKLFDRLIPKIRAKSPGQSMAAHLGGGSRAMILVEGLIAVGLLSAKSIMSIPRGNGIGFV
jgi:hypothetical protein